MRDNIIYSLGSLIIILCIDHYNTFDKKQIKFRFFYQIFLLIIIDFNRINSTGNTIIGLSAVIIHCFPNLHNKQCVSITPVLFPFKNFIIQFSLKKYFSHKDLSAPSKNRIQTPHIYYFYKLQRKSPFIISYFLRNPHSSTHYSFHILKSFICTHTKDEVFHSIKKAPTCSLSNMQGLSCHILSSVILAHRGAE